MQRIYYKLKNIQTDLIVSIGGTPPTTPPVTPLVYTTMCNLGVWYIQLSTFGEPMLCTDYPELQDLPIVAFDGVANYTINPSCDFIKGRPIGR